MKKFASWCVGFGLASCVLSSVCCGHIQKRANATDQKSPTRNDIPTPNNIPTPLPLQKEDGNAPQSNQMGAVLKDAALTFSLPLRSFETAPQTLWATYYYTPRIVVGSDADSYDLLDLTDLPLGPRLTHRQWCDTAMEGSAQIFYQGQWKTYNYAGVSQNSQVDCSRYFKHPVGRTRFRPARGAFGDGVNQYILSPFRTIAVDPAVIPYGTVIYIESARGQLLTMPDGTRRQHDGYFFAGDTGGLIRDQHVDVFIGIAERNPFPWVTSNANSRIPYQIVPDADLREALLAIHLQ